MKLETNLSNDIDKKNKNSEFLEVERQEKFIETKLGQVINAGIDVGLRAVLPDLIEDQVIQIKDNFLSEGLQGGIKECINDAIHLGKSVKGMITGNFENVEEVQSVIRNVGIIDGVSEALDTAIDKAKRTNLISENTAYLIDKGKDIILDNVSKKIENEFLSQINDIEKIQKYSNNWKEYFNNKNFYGMEKEFKKIKEKLKNLIPLENTLKNVRVIENLHTLIKRNNQNFNLSEEQLELAQKLI